METNILVYRHHIPFLIWQIMFHLLRATDFIQVRLRNTTDNSTEIGAHSVFLSITFKAIQSEKQEKSPWFL